MTEIPGAANSVSLDSYGSEELAIATNSGTKIYTFNNNSNTFELVYSKGIEYKLLTIVELTVN
tara:strand:- start:128 stop:316 length:189 start_codon:yes stop_codon:yes gene_type:complete